MISIKLDKIYKLPIGKKSIHDGSRVSWFDCCILGRVNGIHEETASRSDYKRTNVILMGQAEQIWR